MLTLVPTYLILRIVVTNRDFIPVLDNISIATYDRLRQFGNIRLQFNRH